MRPSGSTIPATEVRANDFTHALRHLAAGADGCWFDTALDTHEGLHLAAAFPSALITGRLPDVTPLEDALRRHACNGADTGMPDGGLAGWFDYEGRYVFGVFQKLHTATGEAPCLPDAEQCPPITLTFRPRRDRDWFVRAVQKTQDYIAAGDIYQACISYRHEAEAPDSAAWPFYLALRHYSPAPHAAFLRLGGMTVCSASPETFLRISGRRILTRPIKGTRPRRSRPDDDERSAYELLTSQKEIAELVMITDLERNDLGRVCEYGSVTATELLKLERYEQVFHLVSTVEGNLREEVSHPRALAECFPGGSITGAPKKRACEIIAEIEQEERGLYTGAIGYFGFNGESQFNIAIRTTVFDGRRAVFGAGAGIVADSIPEFEWEETCHKASGILLAASRMTEG